MQKRGHWILGTVLGLLFVLIADNLALGWFEFGVVPILIIAGIILFYSILPDMDHTNSSITWWFFAIGLLGVGFSIIEMLADFGEPMPLLIMSTIFLIVTFISAKAVPHRGFIHTVQVGIISVIPLWFLFHNFGYCLLGYIAWHSHLMGDGYFFKTH